MKTKFEIGDEVFKPNDWGEEGYLYLGIVEGVQVYKCRNQWHQKHSDTDTIEVIYYSDKPDGSNSNGIEATEVFKTKEEAISATIGNKERKLAEAKERLAQDEAKIEHLREMLLYWKDNKGE